MELSEVTKVIDITYDKEVNEYLDLGWKIISVYATAYAPYPGSSQTRHYVMGWVGADPRYPAKPESGNPDLPW